MCNLWNPMWIVFYSCTKPSSSTFPSFHERHLLSYFEQFVRCVWYEINKSTHENWVGVTMNTIKYILSHNNQRLFNLLTIVDAPSCIHTSVMLWGGTREGRGIYKARTVAYEPSYHRISWIRNTLSRGQFLMKKIYLNKCLLPCRIREVWGCRAMKSGGSDGCQGGGSDEFIAFSSDVHGCRDFFQCPCMCYLGILWRTPMIQKIGQCHATF